MIGKIEENTNSPGKRVCWKSSFGANSSAAVACGGDNSCYKKTFQAAVEDKYNVGIACFYFTYCAF